MAKSSSPPKFSSNKLLKESSGVYSFRCFDSCVGTYFSTRRYDQNNFSEFLSVVGIAQNQVLRIRQVHGNQVFIARDRNAKESPPEADAVLTHQKGKALLILTADCLPLFLYDSKKEVVGLVHAGWRGLKQKIVGHSIVQMVQEYGSRPQDIQVAIGPGIEAPCYEVGAEFSRHFPQYYSPSSSEKGHLGLREIAWDQLVSRGVLEKNIADPKICTKCQTDVFPSARGGSGQIRILSMIVLRS